MLGSRAARVRREVATESSVATFLVPRSARRRLARQHIAARLQLREDGVQRTPRHVAVLVELGGPGRDGVTVRRHHAAADQQLLEALCSSCPALDLDRDVAVGRHALEGLVLELHRRGELGLLQSCVYSLEFLMNCISTV